MRIKPIIQAGLVLFMLVIQAVILFSQELKEIYIECDPEEFEYIYENYSQDINIPVIITYNNTSWDDALMRLRGDSSREYPKKSLKVQFPSDPFITGRAVVNFNAEYHDISYMHSTLSTLLFKEAGIPAPDMEHVRIYLNGDFFGLYIMTENMDEEFMEDKGLDPQEVLYKAAIDGACLSRYDNVFYHWDLKSGEDPYQDKLSGLIKDLNASGINFAEYLQSDWDKERTLGFLALNMLLSNGSTYYHNYFLYHNAQDEQWQIFPWDLDRTFTDYSIWYPFHRSSGSWTPDNPLLERALINETLFTEIRETVDDMHEGFFNPEFLYPKMDSIRDVISASVEEDSTDNIPDLQTWLNKIAADKQFVVDRYDQLQHQFLHSPSAFRVDRITNYFLPGQEITFEWQQATDPDEGDIVTYSLYFSPDRDFNDPETVEIHEISSTSITMDAPEETGRYYWMVEATDGSNTIQGFDTYNELFVSMEIPDIVINEINYSSLSSFDPGDWVELYNKQPEEADLTGWRFRDENNNHVFIFPAGTVIEAGGYLVLCRDSLEFKSVFPLVSPVLGNLDFGFSSNGDLLRLYNNVGYLVDSVPYRTEYPWPEEPNGDGPTLELLNPALDNAVGYNWSASEQYGTPGQLNGAYSPELVEDRGDQDQIAKVYPNPCVDQLHIQTTKSAIGSVQVKIMDVNGRIWVEEVLDDNHQVAKTHTIGIGELPPGIYTCLLSVDGGIVRTELLIKK